MAADDGSGGGGGGGEEEVTYSLAAFNHAATIFEEWGKAMLTSLDDLIGMTILAGDFPAATNLKTVVDARITSMNTNVTGLGNRFKFIGTKLRDIGVQYEKAEDKNKDDADRIDPIYDGVNDLPEGDPAPAGGGA